MENIINRTVVQLTSAENHRFTAMATAIEFANAGRLVLFVALNNKRINEMISEDPRACRIDSGGAGQGQSIHCVPFKRDLKHASEYDAVVIAVEESAIHRFLDVDNFVKGDEETRHIPIFVHRKTAGTPPLSRRELMRRGHQDAEDVGLPVASGYDHTDTEFIRRARQTRSDWSSQFTFTRTVDVDLFVEPYRSREDEIRIAAKLVWGRLLREGKVDTLLTSHGVRLTDLDLADEHIRSKMVYQTVYYLRQPEIARATQMQELHDVTQAEATIFVGHRQRMFSRVTVLTTIMQHIGIYEDWLNLRDIDIDQATGVAIKDYVRANPSVMPMLTGYGLTDRSLLNTSPAKSLAVAESFMERVGYIRASSRRVRANGADRQVFRMTPTDFHKTLANSIQRKYTDSTPDETTLSASGVISLYTIYGDDPTPDPTAPKASMELGRIRKIQDMPASIEGSDDEEIRAFHADKHLWDSSPPVLKQDGHDDQREASYRAIQKSIDDMGVIHLPNPKYREAKALDPKGRRYSYFRWSFTNQKKEKFKAMVQSISKSHRGYLRALPGRTIINFDMKQCHFRIAARLAAPFDGQGQFRNYVNQDDFYQHMADDIGVTRSVAKTCALSLLNGAGPGKLVQEYKISHKEAYALHKGFNTKARSWNTWRSEVNKQDPLPFRWDKKSKCMAAVRDHTRGALELQIVERRILDAFLDAIREKIPALRLLVSIYDGAVWDIATTDLDLIEQAKTLIVDTFKDTANQQGYPELQATVGSGASWGEAEGK